MAWNKKEVKEYIACLLKASVAISSVTFLFGCGGDNDNKSSSVEMSPSEVATIFELGPCNADRNGDTVLVLDKSIEYLCMGTGLTSRRGLALLLQMILPRYQTLQKLTSRMCRPPKYRPSTISVRVPKNVKEPECSLLKREWAMSVILRNGNRWWCNPLRAHWKTVPFQAAIPKNPNFPPAVPLTTRSVQIAAPVRPQNSPI